MRKLLIALLTLIAFNNFAQNNAADSLKQLLQTDMHDTTRVLVLSRLAFDLSNSRPDTALILAKQGLALARQKGFESGEANCLYTHGAIFLQTGNYPKALDYFLQALKKYEFRDHREGILSAYLMIGTVYGDMGDEPMAISYYRKSKTLTESIPDHSASVYVLMNLGDAYEKLNQLDSARVYTNQAFELAIRLNNVELRMFALNNLGNIYSKMQQGEIAMGYYRQSRSLETKVRNFSLLCETMLGMAELFKETGQADSSLHYARLSLAAGTEGGFSTELLKVCYFLTGYYKDLNQWDSAFYYQAVTIVAKDSLFNQEKVKKVQNLTFEEKIRQQEIEEAARSAREERIANIQLLGIVTFISFFFALLFVFSRRHVNPKVIKFLGLLGLLLLFEFISLFLHPYIATLTHHTPVYMLLILVAIASMLVPMHHRLQGWVKEKLAKKSMPSLSEDEMKLSEPFIEKVKIAE